MKIHCKRGHELSEENTYTNPSGKRSCRECRRTKAREWYAANPETQNANSRKYRVTNPEQCREYARKWYEDNKEKNWECSRKWKKDHPDKRRVQQRAARLKRVYGISLDQYDLMSLEQGHVCAICRQPNPNGRRLSVDHSHETGAIRGLLCSDCNSLLGFAQDDIDIMISAANYVRRSTA